MRLLKRLVTQPHKQGVRRQAASESPNTTNTTSTTASTSTATSTATSEANSNTPATSSETNITGGEYYLGDYGLWHYRDANGKDLVGPQTDLMVLKSNFYKTGAQARGEFAEDRKYYDNEKEPWSQIAMSPTKMTPTMLMKMATP